MKLQGIFVPVTVPFHHNGDLYKIKVQHNVEKWNRTSVSGYVVCGDEGRYLSSDEKIRVWGWVAAHCAPEKILDCHDRLPERSRDGGTDESRRDAGI